MNKAGVAVVVVTYNRCHDLDQALRAIEGQSALVEKIYVIDNASTDGTESYLAAKMDDCGAKYVIIRAKENEGGAGGFYRGICRAIEDGHDLVWVMDDDCIAYPDALAQLLAVQRHSVSNLGFVCSHVVWSDGQPHKMNLPGIRLYAGDTPFNKYIEFDALAVRSCSFVSVLISREAVLQCGLPIREMFIWGDDLEYTRRIVDSGLVGLYAFKSIVKHHTRVNDNDNLFFANRSSFKKHYYGIRNNLFLVRRDRGLVSYVINLLENIVMFNFELIFRRRDSRLLAVAVNSLASFASLFFWPKVRFPSRDSI